MPQAKIIDDAIKHVREAVYKHFPDLTLFNHADATNEILDLALNRWGLKAYESLLAMEQDDIIKTFLHIA